MKNTDILLKEHKDSVKDYLRKRRNDKGLKREDYKSILPDKYKSYLSRANAKGLRFELTVVDFDRIVGLNCYYCGGRGGGVDRLDSSEGYIEGNVQPCCGRCNLMKHKYSEQDFIGHIIKIYNNFKK